MSRNLRDYSRQTAVRLIVGGFIILFFIGNGLIYIFYGRDAAFLGVICMGIGLLPLVMIGLLFWIMDRIVRRGNVE